MRRRSFWTLLISRCLTLAAGLQKWEEMWLTDIIILTVQVGLFWVLHITSHHKVYLDRQVFFFFFPGTENELPAKYSGLVSVWSAVVVVDQVYIRTP